MPVSCAKKDFQTPPPPNTPTRAQKRRRWENESSTRTALELFRAEVQALQVEWCPGLVRVTSSLVRKWREAEEETGQALTLCGRPRIQKSQPVVSFQCSQTKEKDNG